jgi:hypothetical protein
VLWHLVEAVLKQKILLLRAKSLMQIRHESILVSLKARDVISVYIQFSVPAMKDS